MPVDIIIVNIAYSLTFIALAIREIYWLRIILTIAQFGQLAHAYLRVDYSKGFWTTIFVIINIIQIIIIYLDRRDLPIPEEIKDLYDNIFHTKSRREFLKFWDAGKVCQLENETVIKSGDTQADLLLILNGKANVVRDGKKIATLERGQFIAEISYITGNPASADVIAQDELLFYTWPRDILNKLRKSNPATMGKLDRILTLDMAGKLTR
ncbi:uncharacterized protein METZ01_LOCUS413076 [marine metagenome]|uniref:Cyclic nucleotide-binding domain-containing protein n=1 Tax=marine metagenome TaxID=408172 RepID=A0A382WN38_9ZZZZ